MTVLETIAQLRMSNTSFQTILLAPERSKNRKKVIFLEYEKPSKAIKEFISLVDSANNNLPFLEEGLELANAASSDLLHYIELEQPSASQMVKVYKKQQENRRVRRELKDRIELAKPISQWKKRHTQACKELTELLGVIRKIEHAQNTRAYACRTHVLDDITEKHHLVKRTVGGEGLG